MSGSYNGDEGSRNEYYARLPRVPTPKRDPACFFQSLYGHLLSFTHKNDAALPFLLACSLGLILQLTHLFSTRRVACRCMKSFRFLPPRARRKKQEKRRLDERYWP